MLHALRNVHAQNSGHENSLRGQVKLQGEVSTDSRMLHCWDQLTGMEKDHLENMPIVGTTNILSQPHSYSCTGLLVAPSSQSCGLFTGKFQHALNIDSSHGRWLHWTSMTSIRGFAYQQQKVTNKAMSTPQ